MLVGPLFSDSAEAFGFHAQKRSNVLKRNISQQGGVNANQFSVPLFGREGCQIIGPIFIVGDCLFENEGAEIAEAVAHLD